MEDDNMILFFTGTGNSRYIARKIADSLGDGLLNMNERIKADTSGKEVYRRGLEELVASAASLFLTLL